jgi:hypothetical protein
VFSGTGRYASSDGASFTAVYEFGMLKFHIRHMLPMAHPAIPVRIKKYCEKVKRVFIFYNPVA